MVAPASMTGFGSARGSVPGASVHVDVRSTNARFLDVVVKSPSAYGIFDGAVRRLVDQYGGRGRVEILIDRVVARDTVVNKGALASAKRRIESVTKVRLSGREIHELILRKDSGLMTLVEPVPSPREKRLFLQVVREALERWSMMRAREGSFLVADLRQRLHALTKNNRALAALVRRERKVVERELRERVQEMFRRQNGVGDEVIVREVIAGLEKRDTTEEQVRLTSHFGELGRALKQREAGRAVEFLVQECVRELTTLATKARSASVQRLVVAMKGELERVREQALNLE